MLPSEGRRSQKYQRPDQVREPERIRADTAAAGSFIDRLSQNLNLAAGF